MDKGANQEYTFEEHSHRYACWTAARSASISRFSNIEIAGFIQRISLRLKLEKLRAQKNVAHWQYKNWFIENVRLLKEEMETNSVRIPAKHRKISFGIAAKVMSVYVKTYEVITSKGRSNLSQVAFPPIDRFLLSGLTGGVRGLQIKPWSQLQEKEFLLLIEKLRSYVGDNPFWTIEENWNLGSKKVTTISQTEFKKRISGIVGAKIPSKTGSAQYKIYSLNSPILSFKRINTGEDWTLDINELYSIYKSNSFINTSVVKMTFGRRVNSP
jgi:hypothetical protein